MAEATIVFATISRQEDRIFQRTLQQDLIDAIQPARNAIRYGRTWKFSRPEQDGEFLSPKLGFLRPELQTLPRYDPEEEDYVDEIRQDEFVRYSHFAIGITDLRLAFELKPGYINVQSFIGAFRATVNQSEYASFDIQLVRSGPGFGDWLQSVKRLRWFRGVVRPHNPHYSERTDQLEKLVKETNSDRLILDASKAKGQNDNLVEQNTVLGEIVESEQEGYAEFLAITEANGQLVVF